MAEWIGIGRRARRCYGFDEIALVPGTVTVNPNEVDTTWEFDGRKFRVPILAAAMDGVVDVKFAVEMGKIGGLAVLNLDGVQTRYDKPEEVLNIGVEWAATQVRELLDRNVPSVHFYIMLNSRPITMLMERLNIFKKVF